MCNSLLAKLESGMLDDGFVSAYGKQHLAAKKSRATALMGQFTEQFGTQATHLFSAPGRTEIGGNHTDHQKGCVLAAAVNLDALAAVASNDLGKIRLRSEGYAMVEVALDSLEPNAAEFGTTTSLVRGVLGAFAKLGCAFGDVGFDAFVTSDVLSGSGLSSSAAFEVLVGNIINKLYWNDGCTAVEIAQMGQFAENVYFGKPCGLMDQMASSVGGVVSIDFGGEQPVVNAISLDFDDMGHALCIVDSGVDHADLTDEYANITIEMGEVSKFFGKQYLSEIEPAEFYHNLAALKKAVTGRAIMRAMHFYSDTALALDEAQALRDKDYATFLRYIGQSGTSSLQCLQNVLETGETKEQGLLLAITVCQYLLQGAGAVRVHGGGFAGTAQAFVPMAQVADFKATYEEIFGENTCHVLSIRPVGGICLGS